MGFIATLVSALIASVALSPLQIWKTRKQTYKYVQYTYKNNNTTNYNKRSRLKSSNDEDEDFGPKDCFIEQFGWTTLHVGIGAELFSTIPLTTIIYFVCNIWDEKTMDNLINNGYSSLNELIYFIFIGTIAGLATTISDNRKIALQFNVPCKTYFEGYHLSIVKEILYWGSFILCFMYCLTIRKAYCTEKVQGLEFLACKSIWLSGVVSGLIAGFISHPLDALSAQFKAKVLQKMSGFTNYDLLSSKYLLSVHSLVRGESVWSLYAGLVGRLLFIILHFTVTVLWANLLVQLVK